jgi:hypothetical protein
MMKKLLVCIGLLAMLAQPALAFRPSGWVYFNWPWAFDAGSGDWHWFKTNDTQWVNGFTSGGWITLPASALASGWSFYACPYAYSTKRGTATSGPCGAFGGCALTFAGGIRNKKRSIGMVCCGFNGIVNRDRRGNGCRSGA